MEPISIKVLLSDDEIGINVLEDLCNKFIEWLSLATEPAGGRVTRSANRRADIIYNDIINYSLPPFNVSTLEIEPPKVYITATNSSLSSDSTSSRPVTRSRSRTPTVQTPSTPRNQKIRTNLRQMANGGNSGPNVLSAALKQQHPSVSLNKIRQLLRADSAQKKKDEERERQERLIQDRKAKEERAEEKKKLMLEERAARAKLKREQRLNHAAELRKARLDELAKKAPLTNQLQAPKDMQQNLNQSQKPQKDEQTTNEALDRSEESPPKPVPSNEPDQPPVAESKEPEKPKTLNETFQRPADVVDNIDISFHDETTDDVKNKNPQTAAWARAPALRMALIKQFTNQPDISRIFPPVELPVELEQIFGQSKAVTAKYLCRTSSAVWHTPPQQGLKRSSSCVFTPNENQKR